MEVKEVKDINDFVLRFDQFLSTCWALTKSWLNVQFDLELSGESERSEDINSESLLGPENWPLQVLNQQPRDLSALLQKLHSR